MSDEISIRIEAAKGAVNTQVEFLHREFGRVASQWKHDGSRVTAADLAISEAIVAQLRGRFPEDDFFSEELAPTREPMPVRARFAWVLDPIDGTNNYAKGIPYCAISLALLEVGQPIYGVVYDLSRRVLMHGGPGRGMFDGDRAAKMKPDAPDRQSLIGLHSPIDKSLAGEILPLIERFKLRGLGSSTLHLAYVAAGLLEGAVDHNVKIWDIAAALPLCWGAGGEAHFLNGSPLPLRVFDLNMPRIHYVAGNAAMCAELRRALRR